MKDRPLRWVAVLFFGGWLAVAMLASLGEPEGLPGGPAGQDLVPGVATEIILAWWALAARSTLLLTLTATLTSALAGSVVAVFSIYLPGGLGAAFARLIALGGVVPSIALVGMLRFWDPSHGVLSLAATLSLLRTVEVAELVRTRVLTVMSSEYVQASRAFGASGRWQFRVHVLPRLWVPLAADLAFGASILIGLEAALGFVGLGLPASVASWGSALPALARGGSVEALTWAVASLGICSATLHWMGTRLAAAERERPHLGRPRLRNLSRSAKCRA